MNAWRTLWCHKCKSETDHYAVDYGHRALRICDVCETPARKNRR